jgi:hypothetical protein
MNKPEEQKTPTECDEAIIVQIGSECFLMEIIGDELTEPKKVIFSHTCVIGDEELEEIIKKKYFEARQKKTEEQKTPMKYDEVFIVQKKGNG